VPGETAVHATADRMASTTMSAPTLRPCGYS